MGAALEHFEAARAAEPGYCEPAYWIGATSLNQGRRGGQGRFWRSMGLLCVLHVLLPSFSASLRFPVTSEAWARPSHPCCCAGLSHAGDVNRGLRELEAAVACKYVAAESLKALNTIYQVGLLRPQSLLPSLAC